MTKLAAESVLLLRRRLQKAAKRQTVHAAQTTVTTIVGASAKQGGITMRRNLSLSCRTFLQNCLAFPLKLNSRITLSATTPPAALGMFCGRAFSNQTLVVSI